MTLTIADLNIAQVFNKLIDLFNGCIRNIPETIMSGRIATKGRIEYQFQAFGSVSLVFVEVKYDIKERSKAIAQVIAECDGKYSKPPLISQ
jgi:hypothetical protein